MALKTARNPRRVRAPRLKFLRSVLEAGDGGAEVRLARVPELGDEGMPLECLLHDAALDALAAAVNQPDLAQARLVRGVHLLLDDRLDIARREGVEIEERLDGDVVSHVNSRPSS